MPEHTSWFGLLLPLDKLRESLGISYIAKVTPGLEHVFGASFIIIMSILMVLWARRRWRNTEAALVPEAKFTVSTFFEMLIETALSVMADVFGDMKKAREYLPFIGTFAVFILFSNIIGLVPGFLPPTDNVNTTWGIAIIIFCFYHYAGTREIWRHMIHHAHGEVTAFQKFILFPIKAIGQYVGHFANPMGFWWGWFLAPLMFPIELISHLARPLSLGLRLMGNIFGDHMVTGIFLALVAVLVPLPIMVLGLIVCVIQTLVFCLLSTVYISMAVTHE